MKSLLVLLPLLASCVGGASVTRTSKGTYHATSGYTLLGKRENVLVEMETREGDKIRYSTTNEDGTEVVQDYIGWWGSAKLLKISQPAVLKGTKDPNVIPKDPNVIPKDPNVIPLDPNIHP